ncbi:hypothetical protein DFQ30_010519, partial [Apophysomyces sp. BC1015]
QLTELRRKRNRLLRSKPPLAVIRECLPLIKRQISILQTELVQNDALRARKEWREKGETSARYLKNICTTRQSKQYIHQLVNPNTGAITQSPLELEDIAQQFYQELYSPDPVDVSATDQLLDAIPSDRRLSSQQQQDMADEIGVEELREQVKRCRTQSSPGTDGIPYSILYLVFQHPIYTQLLHTVYNDALKHSRYPPRPGNPPV